MGRGINRGHQRRQELKERADVFTEERAARTPTQQLALLDARLGEAMGARKERAKLIAEMLPRIDAAEAKKEMKKAAKKKKK
jgi:hypothetical protein